MKSPARHDFPTEKFPITIRLISGTGAVVWERVVTIDEAKDLARVEVPSFANTEHCPIRTEILYGDGTTEIGETS